MWVVALVVLGLLVAVPVGLLNRGVRQPDLHSHWDLAALGTSYAGIVSPLATFSVASAVFLAGVTRAVGTQDFANVMALFLIAFIMLMGTALMFATTRSIAGNANDAETIISRRIMHILCNAGFYLGLNMSWLGLRPLLASLELWTIADVFTWLLLFSFLSGANRLGAWMSSLLGVKAMVSYSLVFIPFTAAAFFRFVVAPLWTAAWPPDATLTFAVAVLAVGSPSFVLETNMIRFHGTGRGERALARIGPAVLPSYVALGVAALSLLWLSLVTSQPA